MSDVWLTIVLMTAISFVLKAAGPVLVGGRELPGPARRLIVLLPAALLTALVGVQTFADDRELVLDARAGGVAVAISAVALRAPILVVLVLAAGSTAALRAL